MNAQSLSIEAAWLACGDLFREATESRVQLGRHAIEHELLFCLLGGFSVSYEHSRSATEIITRLRPFADHWDREELFEAVLKKLSQAQFEPRRKDGSLRRYRFPKRKATLVVKARDWLQQLPLPLSEELASIPDERRRRDRLCECPGFGPKSASWLLRNVGLGTRLAIIDVHVLRAMSSGGRISSLKMPRDYEAAEDAFLEWCDELDAPPAAFDLFVWEWQRGSLQPK